MEEPLAVNASLDDGGLALGTSRGRIALTATVAASGMASLDATVVNVALPQIGSEFDASLSALQWVLTGYLLALGIPDPARGCARRPVRATPGVRDRHDLVRGCVAALRRRPE